jgi:hypothetical protein
MSLLLDLMEVLLGTLQDVAPIVVIVVGFQFAVIRKPLPNARRLVAGFVYVLVGLSLFLVGLQWCLFPLGRVMATQLTDPVFIAGSEAGVELAKNVIPPDWRDYGWVYLFAFMIGFSTTIAEPSLMAVAIKANQVSAGVISVWGLRIAVALGVAIGIALGSYRIIVGDPIQYYIIVGYMLVIIQTSMAPKMIVPLAYDSGGVTTSTVTVPLVAALGLGLAETVPGRNPLVDGFGLIAFAGPFPIVSVLFYAQISNWAGSRARQTPE